jgi:hypothetical protein
MAYRLALRNLVPDKTRYRLEVQLTAGPCLSTCDLLAISIEAWICMYSFRCTRYKGNSSTVLFESELRFFLLSVDIRHFVSFENSAVTKISQKLISFF